MINFLKLGGSLITDKSKEKRVHRRRLDRLAKEAAAAITANPETKWVLGHGSGSFGHFTAAKYQTQRGVISALDWKGFVQVWRDARELNQIVTDALLQAGIPVIHFPASAFLTTRTRLVKTVYADPLIHALSKGLVPLVAGDVIFDHEIGGTIFSTEEILAALSEDITPTRVLLCGLDRGVFADFPKNRQLIPVLRAGSVAFDRIQGSNGVDVTGGMLTKVQLMMDMVQRHPETTVQIFDGIKKDNLLNVMLGSEIGTVIRS